MMKKILIVWTTLFILAPQAATASPSACQSVFRSEIFDSQNLIGFKNLDSWKNLTTDPKQHRDDKFTYFAHAFHTKWSTYQKAMNDLDKTFAGDRLISLSVITQDHQHTLGGNTRFDRGAQNYGVLLNIDPSKIIATSPKDFASAVGRSRSDISKLIEQINKAEPIRNAHSLIAEMDAGDVMSAPHSEVVVVGSPNHKVAAGFITVTRDMTPEEAIESIFAQKAGMYSSKDRTALRKFLKYLEKNELPIILLKVPPRWPRM